MIGEGIIKQKRAFALIRHYFGEIFTKKRHSLQLFELNATIGRITVKLSQKILTKIANSNSTFIDITAKLIQMFNSHFNRNIKMDFNQTCA